MDQVSGGFYSSQFGLQEPASKRSKTDNRTDIAKRILTEPNHAVHSPEKLNLKRPNSPIKTDHPTKKIKLSSTQLPEVEKKACHPFDINRTSPFMSQIVRKEAIAYEVKCLNGNIKKIVKIREVSLAEEIEGAIEHFLFPYITNQVDPEEEKKQLLRESLSVTICKQLILLNSNLECLKEGENFNALQFFILDHYITCAAKGLYTNNHVKSVLREVVTEGHMKFPEEFEISLNELPEEERKGLQQDQEYLNLKNEFLGLFKPEEREICPLFSKTALVYLTALVPALKIDFPNLCLTVSQICQKGLNILRKVQIKREDMYIERKKDFKITEEEASKVPAGCLPKELIYHKLQRDALEIYIKEAMSKLPNENNVMYLSDLSEEDQVITLDDPEYKLMLDAYQEWCILLEEEVEDIKLTKEGFLVLFEVLQKLSIFKKPSLIMQEIVHAIEEKLA